MFAVVMTNQVNYSSHRNTAKPTGGNIIAHSSTYRISLRRLRPDHNNNDENYDDGEIVAKVVRSLIPSGKPGSLYVKRKRHRRYTEGSI